jgi:serine/threonine-protein kinase
MRIPQELAAGIVAQVCDGLEHAHQLDDGTGDPMHIVHRDVSPQNIIVLYSGLVKLVDFGIAKATSQVHETRTGALRGKLKYMSPEQCQGGPIDGRSDVFSLGVVFWELLTQQRLFKGKNEMAMIQTILKQPIPAPRQVVPSVSEEFSIIAEHALMRDLDLRYQSAGEMGAAIREAIRQNTFAAGVSEIAAYAKKVLAGREMTKKAILQALQRETDTPVPLRILRPETAEPSQPGPEANGETDKSLPGLQPDGPDGKAKRRWWLPLVLVSVLAVAGTAVWLGLTWKPESGPGDPPPEKDPVTQPNEPAPGKQNGAVTEKKPNRTGPRKRYGTLRLSTTPWSTVYLKKRKLGITPLADVKLPAGKHRLLAINPEEKIRRSFTVRIRPGKTTTMKIDLKKPARKK